MIFLSGDTPTTTVPSWPFRKAQSVSAAPVSWPVLFLSLHGVGFTATDEGFEFRDCHSALAPPAVNPMLGRREERLCFN
jgi:hypothetical protein